jgi:hypothetical protein
MVLIKMTGNLAQVHPIQVQLERFATHLFGINPGFGVWSDLDLAEHAAIVGCRCLFFQFGVGVLFDGIASCEFVCSSCAVDKLTMVNMETMDVKT